MKINDELIVDIIDNDNIGNGIAKQNNLVIFVKETLKGEKIKVRITNIKKNYAYASIIEILKESEYREKPKCPYYNICGGCSFMHTSYENEINIKKEYLEKLFKREVNILETKKIYNYRNKVVFHVKNNKIGLYNEQTHEICSIDKCLLLKDEINNIYKELKKIDLTNIKEIMIRSVNKEIMLNVITTANINKKDLLLLNIDSLYINSKHIKGKEYLIDEINNLKFTIYPESFYQVNKEGMISIYDKALSYINDSDSLLDLYCGTGTIAIWMNKKSKNIKGYEINPSSIENAKLNLKLNNISNIDFILNDAKNVKGSYDTIIVDPPRSGLSKEVINFLNDKKVKKLIYISCNPNTLKRDIDLLVNYNLIDINACNMFKRTKHIECVSLLQTKDFEK